MEAETITAARALADAVRTGAPRGPVRARLAAHGVGADVADALEALVEAWTLADDVPVEHVRARLRAAYDAYFARTAALKDERFARALEHVDADTAAWVERRSARVRTGLLFEDAGRREWLVYSELDALVARLAPPPADVESDTEASLEFPDSDNDEEASFEFPDSDEDTAEKRRRRREPFVPLAAERLAALERAVAEDATLAPSFARWFEPSVPIEFARLGRALAVDDPAATYEHEQGATYEGPRGVALANVERLVASLLARSSRRDKRELADALALVSSALPGGARGTAFSRALGPALEDRLAAEYAAEAGVADDVELLVGYVLASNTLGADARGQATAMRDQTILRHAIASNRLELAALVLLRAFAADVLVPVHAARTPLLPSPSPPLAPTLRELLVTTRSNRFEVEAADRRERESARAGTRYWQLLERPVLLFWEVPSFASNTTTQAAIARRLAANAAILEAVHALGGAGLVVGARGIGFEEELTLEEWVLDA